MYQRQENVRPWPSLILMPHEKCRGQVFTPCRNSLWLRRYSRSKLGFRPAIAATAAMTLVSEKRPPGCKFGPPWKNWNNSSSWRSILDLWKGLESWAAGALMGVTIFISCLFGKMWWSRRVEKTHVCIGWLHYKSFRWISCSSQSEPSATWCHGESWPISDQMMQCYAMMLDSDWLSQNRSHRLSAELENH